MDRSHEERIRALENDLLVAKTREDHQREIDKRNRRRRTEIISWIAVALASASIIFNIVDRFV